MAHPLYGDVLRAGMSRLRQIRTARSLAEAVEATGRRRSDDDLRVGAWYLLAGGGDPPVLLSAADGARRRFDFALAERLARAAVEADAGFDAALLAAQMAIRLGRGEAAESELAELAVTAPDERRRGAVAVTRVENCLWFTCQFDQGRRLADDAQASLTEPAARDQIGVLLASHIGLTQGFTAALVALEPLLERARGESRVAASVLAAYGLLRMGRLDAAIALTQNCVTLSLSPTEAVGPYQGWKHLVNRCNALVHVGRIEEAEALALDWYRKGVAEQSTECQAMFAWVLARMAGERGRVASAIRYGREAIALHCDIGWHRTRHDVMNNLALALALGGYQQEAADLLDQQEAMGLPTYVHTEVERLQARRLGRGGRPGSGCCPSATA